MNDDAKFLSEVKARLVALVEVGTTKRWEFQLDRVVSISGPPDHPNFCFRTVAIICDDDPDVGVFVANSFTDVARLIRLVQEQDKRARHAEQERDTFNARIDELEAEQTKSWNEFEKEALNAIGSETVGMTIDAGSDIPGMIRRLHERYSAEIRREQTRRIEAEEQRDTYKRIANMKRRKGTP